jgi:hypothetical protein
MKRRRIESAQSLSRHSLSAPNSSHLDSCVGTPASVSYAPPALKEYNKGFLVGFLGSPSWETRVQLSLDKATRKKQLRSSFGYQLHTRSRRHSSRGQHSSVYCNKAEDSRSGSRSVSVASIVDSRALYEIRDATVKRRSRLIRLPTYPTNVYSERSIMRRLSLPNTRQTEPLAKLPDRKRHSSLQSERGITRQLHETSQAGNIIFPGNVRLVNHEQQSADENLSPSSVSLSPASSLQSKFKSKMGHIRVPPLPSLPVTLPTSFFSQSSPSICAPSPITISHPYALAPRNKSPKPATAKYSSVDQSNQEQLDFPVPRPLSLGEDTTSLDNSANSHQSFNNFLIPLHVAPLDIGFPSAKFSPPLSSSPILPASPTTALPIISMPVQPIPNVKPELKHPSTRSKRISRVGPSPLRSVILPEASSGFDLGSLEREHDASNEENKASAFLEHHVQPLDVPSPKLGLGSRRLRKIDEQGSPSDSSPSDRNSKDDPLLEIIRELVEVTRSWDESVFVNESFKSMVKNSVSGEVPSGAASDLTGTSVEIDLGLLGLNRFIHDQDGKDYEHEENSADLRSVWDGAARRWTSQSDWQ